MKRMISTMAAFGMAVSAFAMTAPAEAVTEPLSEAAASSGSLSIGQVYAAAHGTKCFTEAVAVVDGDRIVAAYIDDFQFLDAAADGVVGVPNSDGEFGQNYAEGVVLGSKRQNTDMYSALMKEKAQSTVAIDQNFDAIADFAAGKTIDELDAAASSDDAVDSVSGATLADTAGYLKAIADAARAAQGNTPVSFDGDENSLTLKVSYGAAHGDKCFTTAAALTDGTNIILSYIDDFQFMDASTENLVGVPNSDADFGAGYAEGVVLASKRENAASYSAHMKEKAQSTVPIDENYDAIQACADTLSIAEAQELSQNPDAVDSVSGATLVDTPNYIGLIAATAQQ